MVGYGSSSIAIGMNARLFAVNWRPVRQEIVFARQIGCDYLQVHGSEQGADHAYFGDELSAVAAALTEQGIRSVMEIVARLRANGRTAKGSLPLDILRNNLAAIQALAIEHVHFHFAPAEPMEEVELCVLEESLIEQLAAGVELAQANGFRLGLEHNEPDVPLFAAIQPIQAALNAVPGLGFVWDVNHTRPAELNDWLSLMPRMTLLHISDTPLPEVNHHLPLGLGNIDFAARFACLFQGGYTGAAILEIGGVPKSGGFGRDTDEALADSAGRLKAILCIT